MTENEKLQQNKLRQFSTDLSIMMLELEFERPGLFAMSNKTPVPRCVEMTC